MTLAIIKPRESERIVLLANEAAQAGAVAFGIDIDAAALINMTRAGQPVGPKSFIELEYIKRNTQIPFIVKGIMTVDDALACAEAGVDAIVVSNHGGRALDHTPGTAEVLPAIARAVQGRLVVMADGGVRSGVDVLKMLALGAANIASSLLQGLPVGAGFSASSANQEAGGRSKWAGVFAAVSIALMLWWLRDWLALLPIPVLAAVVIGILLHKLGPKPVIAPLRMGGDAWLAVAAAAGVLLFGVLFGMLLAVGFSVLLALRRFAEPAWSELGRLPGSHDFLDLARHPEARRVPGVLVVRPEEPVFFANAEAIFQQVRTLAQTGEIRMVVLSMEASDDLDTTSVEALSELQDYLDARGQTLLLARVKDGPRAALQRAGSVLVDGPAAPPHAANSGAQAIIWEMYWSVDDAVTAGYNRLLQERSSSPVPQDHEAV